MWITYYSHFLYTLQIRNDPDKFADRELEICVKFSGDGARFSSSSSFLLLSFSLPGTATNVLSGAGKLSNVSKKLDWQRIFLFL